MKHPILRRIPGARQWIEKIERLEAERDRLVRRVEKLQGPSPSNNEPSKPRRDDYKKVWSDLSRDERSARMHVGGFEDEETFDNTGRLTVEALQGSVGIRPDDVVAEIGCGVGRVGKLLAPVCAQWIGCDVSPHMLAIAAKRLAGLTNVALHEISGFDLRPLADNSVDVVYSTVVFMHLDEWDRYNYVVEAYRVLRPGGRCFIDNVDLCSEEGWRTFEVHRQIPPALRPPHITKHSTAEELTTYLRRAGFENVTSRHASEFVQVWGAKKKPAHGIAPQIPSHLDIPAPGALVYADAISISGWVYSPAKDMSRCTVRARIGREVIGETTIFGIRPDVNRIHGLPAKTPTGFRLLGRSKQAGMSELVVSASWNNEEVEIARCQINVIGSFLDQRTFGDVVPPNQTHVLHREDIYGTGPPVEIPGAEALFLIEQYLEPGTSVVDIGCGTGAYGQELIAHGHPWMGLEVNPDCLEFLERRQLPYRSLPKRGNDFPFADGEFDHAVCIEVLEHVEEPDHFLSELTRIIRRRALFSVPNFEVLPYFNPLQVVPWHLLEADHRNFFTRASLKELLGRYFARVEVLSYGEHPIRMPEGIGVHLHLFAIAEK